MTIKKLATEVARQHTGSRFICNPAPTDTDDDWLIMVRDMHNEIDNLYGLGFREGGSDIDHDDKSRSLKRREEAGYDLNLIITDDFTFFDKFCAATALAKSLNVLDKDKRIQLFQTVVSGKVHTHYLRLPKVLGVVQFPIAEPVPQLDQLPPEALVEVPRGMPAWAVNPFAEARPNWAAREDGPAPETEAPAAPEVNGLDVWERIIQQDARRQADAAAQAAAVNAAQAIMAAQPMPQPRAGFDWREVARRAGVARFR